MNPHQNRYNLNKNILQELKANTFRVEQEGKIYYVIVIDKVIEILDL